MVVMAIGNHVGYQAYHTQRPCW